MPSRTSVTRSGRAPSAARSWPLAAAPLAAVILAAVAAALGTQLLAVWPDAQATMLRWTAPSTLQIDSLIAAPLLAAGALLAAWWSVSLALIAASLLADRAGVRSTALLRCIHAVAPRTLRRLAVAGVGAGLTFSTLPAQAAEEPPDLGWAVTRQAAASPAPTDVTTAPEVLGDQVSDQVSTVPSGEDSVTPPAPAQHGSPPAGVVRTQPVDPTGLGAPVPLTGTAGGADRGTGSGVDGSAGLAAPGQARTGQAQPGSGPAQESAPPAPEPMPVPEQPKPAPVESVPDPVAPGSAAPSGSSGPGTAPSGSSAHGAGGPGPGSGSGAGPGSSAAPGATSPAPPTAHRSPSRPGPTAGVVVVAPGDTLWDLAAAALPATATDAQIATAWQGWYALNVAVIGDDPDLLRPGQHLQVPSSS